MADSCLSLLSSHLSPWLLFHAWLMEDSFECRYFPLPCYVARAFKKAEVDMVYFLNSGVPLASYLGCNHEHPQVFFFTHVSSEHIQPYVSHLSYI